MMNKYVRATISFVGPSFAGKDYQVFTGEKSVMVFKSYEELLNYLSGHFCKLCDYEEVSIIRRKKEYQNV